MVLSIYGSADHSGGQSVKMQHANFARQHWSIGVDNS